MMLEKYRTMLEASDWQSDAAPLSAILREWLLNSGSLTQKMLALNPNLSVAITHEGWLEKGSEKVWQREVILSADGTPWIFAQTNLPEATISNVAQAVPTLGEQPIGLWLFPQNPERLSLEWRQDAASSLYARRSRLSLKGNELEIRELFLPDFLQNFR